MVQRCKGQRVEGRGPENKGRTGATRSRRGNEGGGQPLFNQMRRSCQDRWDCIAFNANAHSNLELRISLSESKKNGLKSSIYAPQSCSERFNTKNWFLMEFLIAKSKVENVHRLCMSFSVGIGMDGAYGTGVSWHS